MGQPGQDLGPRLYAWRKSSGMSQASFAQAVGVTPLTILRWEHGYSKPKSNYVRARLERLLEGTVMPQIDRKGRHHQTAREVIEFVRACLQGECSIDEALVALEKDGVLLDAQLPTDKKEPIYSLCRRIVKTCEQDAEIGAYYKTLWAAAQQACDVAEGKVKKRG